jgi:uncharacterized protein (TIGR02646 family)
MRQIERTVLPPRLQTFLQRRQERIDAEITSGTADVDRSWRSARQTVSIRGPSNSVLHALRQMSGRRERCMYCLDSHGCDIEHFRPKARYPRRMFDWSNLLLCCTECGRYKGDRFPLTQADEPLLIDPTTEDPWRYLDFDPDTGCLIPRIDPVSMREIDKGAQTVAIFRLDQREGLSEACLITFRRLSKLVQQALDAEVTPQVDDLVTALRDVDDHGLLPWCFGPSGRTVEPFRSLHLRYSDVWSGCAEQLL